VCVPVVHLHLLLSCSHFICIHDDFMGRMHNAHAYVHTTQQETSKEAVVSHAEDAQ